MKNLTLIIFKRTKNSKYESGLLIDEEEGGKGNILDSFGKPIKNYWSYSRLSNIFSLNTKGLFDAANSYAELQNSLNAVK